MKKPILIISLALAALAFVFLNFEDAALSNEENIGEEVHLYLGEAKTLEVNNPTRVVIGNPNIVDVTNVTNQQMTLSPKARGATTLVVWGSFGEQAYRVKVFIENTEEIKRRIDNLLANLNCPEVYTKANDEEDRVLLLGAVKTTHDRERISLALGSLKEKTADLILVKEEESVIDIDVQLLELNKDATDTLGFTWPGAITLTDSSGPTSSAVTGLKDVFYVSKFTRSAFNVSLDALVQEGKARVLSRPRLACQSGKEAELLVGGEKPIFTTAVESTVGVSTSVDYKEFGIKLKIKPTVVEDEKLKLGLNVEVSEVGIAEVIGAANAPTAKAYPLTKRTVSTELILRDGQTLAIGGLVKQKSEEDIRKTPILGDLPLLGSLFRKKTTKIGGGTGERGNTELFVTLTPVIISKHVASAINPEIKPEQQETPAVSPALATEAQPAQKETAPSDPLTLYARLIQKRILDHLVYPSSAKEAGFQGTVKLSLLLSYQGELINVAIKESSGYNMIDEAASNIVKQLSPYPPFPASIEKKELSIDIPIVYRLD